MTLLAEANIGLAMRSRIEAELVRLEQREGVKIHLAVESGSRAWGFPSRDSDYDVRFIYQRPIEDYLTVLPMRDVIEMPIDAVLDISGWDMRKALALSLKSNAILLEWLASPIRYRDSGQIPGNIAIFARDAANLATLAYHYDHQARRSLADIIENQGAARLKSYCYAVRASLALLWLRERNGPAPMDLRLLMSDADLPASVKIAINNLVSRKAESNERDATERLPVLDSFLNETLCGPAAAIQQPDRPTPLAQADALFASIVLRTRSP